MGKYLIIILLFLSITSGCSKQQPKEDIEVNTSIDTINKTIAKDTKDTVTSVRQSEISSEKKQQESFFNKNNILYASAFLSGILLTLIFSWLANRSKTENHLTEIKKLQRKIQGLEWELRESKQKTQKVTKTFINKTNVMETVQSDKIDDEISAVKEWDIENKAPITISERILYFPNPNNNGNFKHTEGKETFIDGASIYKFILMDENNALIEFCENKFSVSIALNNRNETILSLATESNAYNPNATQIEIVDGMKAKAQLEGNIWVIKEKAKIKYV